MNYTWYLSRYDYSVRDMVISRGQMANNSWQQGMVDARKTAHYNFLVITTKSEALDWLPRALGVVG
jgi:hypothetical protein